jgi:ElaB/YqjD/DUF883 family membrane-anchored ribosome-binding protein
MKPLSALNSLSCRFTAAALLLSFLLLLNGCIFVINQPSQEEKELLAIQDTVGKQMADVSQKIASGTYSGVEMSDFLAQAENTLKQAVQRINELKIPEKTRQFAEETKKYLDYAGKIFIQLEDLLKDIERLKNESAKLGEKAAEIAKEQIKNIQQSIDFFSDKISQTAKDVQSVREQILKLYNSAN